MSADEIDRRMSALVDGLDLDGPRYQAKLERQRAGVDDAFLDEMERASIDYPPDYDRDRYVDPYPENRSAWDDDFYDVIRESASLDAAYDEASRWVDAWDRLAPLGIVGPDDRDLSLRELERLVSYLG